MIYFDSLKISGFRNLLEQDIHFAQGLNVFLGNNGHGKSNLLEAIYLICTGKSFRTSHIKELIQFNKPGFLIEAKIFKNQIEHHIKLELYPNKKKLTIDSCTYPHFHPLMGLIPVVMITPEMKKIVDGGPLERRKFIDFLASQLSRPYFEKITRYHKAMKQRNAALKCGAVTHVWEQIMAEAWIFIESFRKQLILELQTRANFHLNQYPELSANIALELETSIKNTRLELPELLNHYLKTKPHESLQGSTFHGPHRDEISISLNDQIASATASEGQKKMIVVALCLASFDILKQNLGVDPILFIDDYDAHFDTLRKNWIQSSLKPLSQSFLTSPLFELKSSYNTMKIENGQILEDAIVV